MNNFQKDSCDALTRELEIFQKLLLDIFTRKAMFEEVENLTIKGIKYRDEFFHFYAYDYLRSQLIDLRKFFDKDARVCSISFITKHLSKSSSSLSMHAELFSMWTGEKDKFESITNKHVVHIERDYNVPSEIDKKQLHDFIERLRILLEKLVYDLTEQGYKVPYLSIEPRSAFFEETKLGVQNFFKAVSSF